MNYPDRSIADAIFPAAVVNDRIKTILLTGVTGFLGAHVAKALLRDTNATLVCLVRAQRGVSPQKRLAEVCKKACLDARRVICWGGEFEDLQRANAFLDDEIRTIIHCAASIKPFDSYDDLRQDNVLPIKYILDLASRGCRKTILHVSTLGVFLAQAFRSQRIFEKDVPFLTSQCGNGYLQSKIVAEAILKDAVGRGFDISIIRPSLIGWHSENFEHGEHDLIAMLLRASCFVNRAPALDFQIDSIPVDHVAETIVKIAKQRSWVSNTYHICRGKSANFSELAEQAGLPIVDLQQWASLVMELAPHMADFASHVRNAFNDSASIAIEFSRAFDRTYDDSELRALIGDGRQLNEAIRVTDVDHFGMAHGLHDFDQSGSQQDGKA